MPAVNPAEFLKALLVASPSVIVAIEGEGRVQLWNRPRRQRWLERARDPRLAFAIGYTIAVSYVTKPIHLVALRG